MRGLLDVDGTGEMPLGWYILDSLKYLLEVEKKITNARFNP